MRAIGPSAHDLCELASSLNGYSEFIARETEGVSKNYDKQGPELDQRGITRCLR